MEASFFGDADAGLLLAVKLDGLDFVGVWAGDVYAQYAQAVVEVEVYPALVFATVAVSEMSRYFSPSVWSVMSKVLGVNATYLLTSRSR